MLNLCEFCLFFICITYLFLFKHENFYLKKKYYNVSKYFKL